LQPLHIFWASRNLHRPSVIDPGNVRRGSLATTGRDQPHVHYQSNNTQSTATQRLRAAMCVAAAVCIPVLGAAEAPTAAQDSAKAAPAKASAKSSSKQAVDKPSEKASDTAPAKPTKPSDAAASPDTAKPAPTLDETRLTLSKWIETQQIISKERNDWQQGKEILQGRIELVGKEVGILKDRIKQSEAAVEESNKKRDELVAENDALKASGAQLGEAVTLMEGQLRKLMKQMPEPVATKLAPLMQRMPTDPSNTRVTVAERFQNVLAVLSELNKANSELAISYEIRKFADGSSGEVQVIYIGLAQAYYISPRGDAGIGRPGEDGWTWTPAPEAASAILSTLEIIQGKESPAFVPLPITIK